jgi:hypothetical protein
MTEIIERTTDLHVRIWAEFAAMPGQRLTHAQACRLFAGEPGNVDLALQDLIEAGVLRKVGPYYIRADFAGFTA